MFEVYSTFAMILLVTSTCAPMVARMVRVT